MSEGSASNKSELEKELEELSSRVYLMKDQLQTLERSFIKKHKSVNKLLNLAQDLRGNKWESFTRIFVPWALVICAILAVA